MFNTAQVDVCLKLDSHSPIYLPGETISGQVVLDTQRETTIKNIRISLIGMCTTYATEVESSSTYRPNSDVPRDRSSDIGIPHNETVEFLRVFTVIPTERTGYPTGQYSFPFTMKIPLTCENVEKSLRADWTSTPLPSSFEGIRSDGSIKYRIKAVASIPGILSNQSQQRAINIASLESCNPSSALVQGRKYVEREMAVKFYDYPNESALQWTQRLFGFDTSTECRRLSVRLTHSAAGLPSWDYPLKDIVSMVVFKIDSENDKKGIEYVLREVRSRIVYTIVSTADTYTREDTTVIKLHETSELAAEPLHFSEGSDGRSFCDISKYLSPLPSETSRMHAPFTNVRVPNLSVSSTLQVDVGISPTSGCPIRPKYVRLSSVVPFYNSPTHQLPQGVEMTSPHAGPPPLYDETDVAPNYQP